MVARYSLITQRAMIPKQPHTRNKRVRILGFSYVVAFFIPLDEKYLLMEWTNARLEDKRQWYREPSSSYRSKLLGHETS